MDLGHAVRNAGMSSNDRSVQVIRCGDDVPEHDKDALLDSINDIIGEHWTTTRLVWSGEISPFHRHFGIALCRLQSGRVVGYAIYRRLRVGDSRAIYRAGAGVSAAFGRQGIYRALTQAIFLAECEPAGDAQDIYYAWRTRSPTIWTANARWWRAVAPGIGSGHAADDPHLRDVAIQLAREMYPETPLELPSMVMRHVYDHMTYRV